MSNGTLTLTKAERLLLERRRAGLTQEQAARRHRITRSRYVKIENEQIEFSLKTPTAIRPTVGEKCVILRRRANKTQEEAAEMLGVCRFTINQMESDQADGTALVNLLSK